jgi:hypothetical protein
MWYQVLDHNFQVNMLKKRVGYDEKLILGLGCMFNQKWAMPLHQWLFRIG